MGGAGVVYKIVGFHTCYTTSTLRSSGVLGPSLLSELVS